MQSATAVVSVSPDVCWELFTDVAELRTWVPGLRSVEIITGTRALPTEIHFELAGAHSTASYTLVYAYDREQRHVRWEPKLGKQHGVSGFVRFEPEPTGTRVTYALEHGDARTAADRESGDVRRLLEAFVKRVEHTR